MSQFSKFYTKSRKEKIELLLERDFLTSDMAQYLLANHLLSEDIATSFIENQIGQYPLPYGIALNFIVDNKEVIVPMVIEEPSVVAACSNAAKFVRKTGGFTTSFEERLQTGQIILYNVKDFNHTAQTIINNKQNIINLANTIYPSIVKRGGGVKNIEVRVVSDDYLTVHLYIDTKEAMGANIVNSILEGVSPFLKELLKVDILMSILSNYNYQSLVTSNCRIDIKDVGMEVAQKISRASDYAKLDPYRAVTHNKGIMNGIDAVLMATGNDYRAVSRFINLEDKRR